MELQNRSPRPPPSGDRSSTEGFLKMWIFLGCCGTFLTAPKCSKELSRSVLGWSWACPEVLNLARFCLSKIILQHHFLSASGAPMEDIQNDAFLQFLGWKGIVNVQSFQYKNRTFPCLCDCRKCDFHVGFRFCHRRKPRSTADKDELIGPEAAVQCVDVLLRVCEDHTKVEGRGVLCSLKTLAACVVEVLTTWRESSAREGSSIHIYIYMYICMFVYVYIYMNMYRENITYIEYIYI